MSDQPFEFPEDAARRARAARGDCPEAGELARYAAGQLKGERERAIDEHLNFCGLCEMLASRIETADAAEDGSAEDLSESKARIMAGLRPLLEGPPEQRRERETPRRWWLRPAFAYSVAAAGFVAGFLVPRPAGVHAPPPPTAMQAPPEPRPLMGGAQRVELDANRASGQEIRVSSRGADLVLSFALPLRQGSEYTAVLTNGNGGFSEDPRRVSPSRDGYFYVVLPGERIRPGRWVLRVYERGASSTREFPFPFTVQ